MNGPEVIVLVGVLLVAGGALAPRIHLPAPVVWLLTGVAVGFIPGVDHVELPPEAVLLVFLPAILYWESLTTSLREIRANLRVITLLAVFLVIAPAVVVAVVAHALGLSWPMAVLLGTVVAPTDAIAVAAVARRLPRRNLTTLRAESLINHQSAQVDRIDANAEGAAALPRAHNRNSLLCGTRQLCAVTERSAHRDALNRSSRVICWPSLHVMLHRTEYLGVYRRLNQRDEFRQRLRRPLNRDQRDCRWKMSGGSVLELPGGEPTWVYPDDRLQRAPGTLPDGDDRTAVCTASDECDYIEPSA
jgi:hypothetical protein